MSSKETPGSLGPNQDLLNKWKPINTPITSSKASKASKTLSGWAQLKANGKKDENSSLSSSLSSKKQSTSQVEKEKERGSLESQTSEKSISKEAIQVLRGSHSQGATNITEKSQVLLVSPEKKSELPDLSNIEQNYGSLVPIEITSTEKVLVLLFSESPSNVESLRKAAKEL